MGAGFWDVPWYLGEHTNFIRFNSVQSGALLVAQMIKNLCNAGDPGSIPGLGRSPGAGHGNPL